MIISVVTSYGLNGDGSCCIIPKTRVNKSKHEYEEDLEKIFSEIDGSWVSMRFNDKFGKKIEHYEGKLVKKSYEFYICDNINPTKFHGPIIDKLTKLEYYYVELQVPGIMREEPREFSSRRVSLDTEFSIRSIDHFFW